MSAAPVNFTKPAVKYEVSLDMEQDSEHKYIRDLIGHTKDTIAYFSNQKKAERERSVCAALLRCLGLEFVSTKIQSNNDDPPDIFFKLACFEVLELYDKRRKRLDEYKARLKELEMAKCIEDTLVPFHLPKPISYEELLNKTFAALGSKSLKYGKKLCSDLDALVYIGLPNIFLDIQSPIPKIDKLFNQGWRSLSFVIPPFSHIVFCRDDAPPFLKQFSGLTKSEWKKPDGFFDLD